MTRCRASAPTPSSTSSSTSGRPRADGLHPLCSLFASIDLADEVTREPSDPARTRVDCAGVDRATTSPTRALAEFRARGGPAPAAARDHDRQAHPGRRRPRRRQRRRGGGAARRQRARRQPARRRRAAARSARGPRLRRPQPARARPRARQGTGERVEPIDAAAARRSCWSRSRGPLDAGRLRRARPPRAATRDGSTRRRSGAGRRHAAEPLGRRARERPPAGRPVAAPGARRPLDALRGAGALGAAVSGSGPTCFGLFADRAAAEAARRGLPGALVTELALTYPAPVHVGVPRDHRRGRRRRSSRRIVVWRWRRLSVERKALAAC